MNITELARKLKIPTSELKDILPRLGFDIGRKAIKVDETVANKIIEKFQTERAHIETLRQRPEEAKEEIITEQAAQNNLTIPPVITVRDFAALLKKPVAIVIQELMSNGILANLNERIDYETASIIAQDFGFQTKQQTEEKERDNANDLKIEQLLASGGEKNQSRPPVVIVMGHVDHGKTQLLDAIRKTNIIATESGGITQHIGAYQVIVPPQGKPSSRPHASEGGIPGNARDDRAKRVITFIDTPGHEAFTAMRSRGARVADLAILVIAADDGIMPQTEEVIKIIENAKLPFIVAINKIDKAGADPDKVKQQLAQKNLLPEDWGGQVICVPVSAKTGQGIDSLLEHLLILAEVEHDLIQADANRPAIGTVIEARIDKGEGPIATVIIQTGTLRQGDVVQVGQVVGKIRTMKNFKGEFIDAAEPAVPARILGLKYAPEVGDILQVVEGESVKKILKKVQYQNKLYRDQQNWQTSQAKESNEEDDDKIKSIKLVLKTDTLGSQEAILQSLETLSTEEIKVKVIRQGLGNILDVDVLQAESGQAIIYGFNVKINPRAEEMAKEKKVPYHTYSVIYELFDDVKKEIDKLKSFKVTIVELGRAKVIAIFRTVKNLMIVGALVTKGKIETGAKARILRQDKEIGQGEIVQLQQAKQAVASVPSGTECGLQIKGHTVLQVGDFLEICKEEKTR